MRLVSRDCVRISFYDTFIEEAAADSRGNKKQANFFNVINLRKFRDRYLKIYLFLL